MNEKKEYLRMYITIVVIAFFMGAILGYVYFYEANYKTPQESIDYVESIMRQTIESDDQIFPHLTPHMSLRGSANYYFDWEIVSRFMLAKELENVCGTRRTKWTTQLTSEREKASWYTSCTELCTSLTEEKGSLEDSPAQQQN